MTGIPLEKPLNSPKPFFSHTCLGSRMRYFHGNGIIVQNGERIVIDPHRKAVAGADHILISHAHSDHANVGAKNETPYHMSTPTKDLIHKRIPKTAEVSHYSLKKKFKFDHSKIELVNSGHILGSSQIVIEADEKVVITADFKLQDSIIQKGAEIIPCDTLIIESTFGIPTFEFPSREKVYEQIGSWIKKNVSLNRFVVLAGYSTGKGQELTKIVTEYTDEIPLVYDSVFQNNKVYDAHGCKLGEYLKMDENLHEGNVLIAPPSVVNDQMMDAIAFSLGKRVVSGKATGWQHFGGNNKLFQLSDHADFSQIMEYVEQAAPKRVYTMHGFEKELADSIQKRFNIPASPLPDFPEDGKQKVLDQF